MAKKTIRRFSETVKPFTGDISARKPDTGRPIREVTRMAPGKSSSPSKSSSKKPG